MAPTAADDCVFCGIVRGAVASHVVHEDAETLAFLDINPAADGHTLVVPKLHARDLLDIDIALAAAVMRSVKTVAEHIDRVLAPDGLTLLQANRPAGWQDVFHFHVHVVPRRLHDELVQPWTPRPADPGVLESVARRLRPV
jgi:histidine triad (HIT) family protein